MNCVGFYDVPSARGIPLSPERIFRIPEQQQTYALILLGVDAFRPLSQQQLLELLGNSKPSATALLEKQAKEADSKASDCHELARDPFYAGLKQRFLSTASSYEQYAAYTRSLPREFHAYLVKAKAIFEGTGSFVALLKNDIVSGEHDSLGVSSPEPRDIALAIFAERTISGVEISYHVAE